MILKKVVCVVSSSIYTNLDNYEPLVVGKTYDGILSSFGDLPQVSKYIYINKFWEYKENFMGLSEYREKQLNKLLLK